MIFAHWLNWLAAFLIVAGGLSIMIGASEWWKARNGKRITIEKEGD